MPVIIHRHRRHQVTRELAQRRAAELRRSLSRRSLGKPLANSLTGLVDDPLAVVFDEGTPLR
jgi:hypothetical protein